MSPKVNILLVDDQPTNLLALAAILEPLGESLVTAGTADDALRHLLHQDFAVVLLDVRLDGTTGFEVAQLIRGRERTRYTPVIFLTAYDTHEFPVADAYALGAVDYLTKPLMPEAVRAKVAVFVELFRLRQAERERVERRYRQIVESAADYAIITMDTQGRVDSWNTGAAHLLGYPAAEALGQDGRFLFTPEDRDKGLPEEEMRVALGRGRSENDRWHVRKDGSRFWANGVMTPLRDETGCPCGFVKILRDLTEKKQAEEQLRRWAEELERANHEKDQFLAMLAHELRNPLAPIRNGLQILQQPALAPEMQEQTRAMMDRQLRHLTRLVDDLLDVSRITRGKIHLRLERLDLAQVMRTAAEDRRASLEEAGLDLVLALPATAVWVEGDATRLTQILNNLLDNAIKFADGGRCVRVAVAADDEHRQAVLTVTDQGMGIEKPMLPRLFEVFAQADRSLDRTRGGLGLGLALVKGLTELHGGEVQAASEGPGRGTEITVRLPQAQAPAAAPLSPDPDPPARSSARILIIEDNPDTADSLALLLELQGHEVRVAPNGPQGVRMATTWVPEVVLCDIGLPGLDGYGVARELRKNPATSAVRLLALTGYGQEEDRRRSREAGFDHHLVKPVDLDYLKELLTSAG